jgi:hypothetical protein
LGNDDLGNTRPGAQEGLRDFVETKPFEHTRIIA